MRATLGTVCIVALVASCSLLNVDDLTARDREPVDAGSVDALETEVASGLDIADVSTDSNDGDGGAFDADANANANADADA